MDTQPAAPPEPSGEPLQFEKAEFKDQTQARSCAACRQNIRDEYFAAAGAVLCRVCADRLSGVGGDRKPWWRALRYGLGAAVVGVLVWSLMIKLTGSEWGIVAIGVGLLVGMAVRKGSGGRGGWKYQSLAIALTYFSITASYVPFVIKAFAKAPDPNVSAPGAPVPADSPTATPAKVTPPAESTPAPPSGMPAVLAIALFVVFIFGMAFAVPFLGGASNIMGLVIIGIALYEAWKLNKRVAVTGPFRLGEAAAPAAGAGPASP